MDYIEILNRLNRCHAPSGREGELARLLQELAAPFADDCTIDTLGNLIVHKKGTGKKLLFAAHMDSIGLMVTHIEDNGYLRVGKLGGISLMSTLHTPFRFANGTMAVAVRSEKVKEKELSLQDLYLDIGASNRTDAEEKVQIGDTAVSCLPAFSMGKRLSSPYMDNRISCVILLEAMKRITNHDNDLYFVFTVQEELGLRGAKTAAFHINPDLGLAIDVTSTADEPDSKFDGSCTLGGGAAIKVMDSAVICHPQVINKLSELARGAGIPQQRDILTAGGTDAGAISQTRLGVLTGGISVPCRYIHSPVETVDSDDVEACIALLTEFAKAQF